VSRLKRLLAEISRDELPAGEAAARLAELRKLPPRWRPGARVAGLTLFSVGFGISIQATWPEVVASAVLGLGSALGLAGTAVSETQERLTRVAAANGLPDARIVVLPTALLLSFGRAHPTTIEPIPQQGGELRLDQIAELYELARRASGSWSRSSATA
jgi:uncharacterized membrane protein YjjP (DUF1212 family)